MAVVTKIISISSAGADTGTFTIISDNGTTLATGVTRQQLLEGYSISYEENTTTLITVIDNGDCAGTVDIDVVPPPDLCKTVKYEIDASGSTCSTYTLTCTAGASTVFRFFECGSVDSFEVEVFQGTPQNVCSRIDPVVITGTGSFSKGVKCIGPYFTATLNYKDCNKVNQSVTLNQNNLSFETCMLNNSWDAPPSGVIITVGGICN